MLICLLALLWLCVFFFFFQAEDGIRDLTVTGVQTCALPISETAPTRRVGRRDRPRGGSGIGAPARLWPACRGESRYSSGDGTASTERARMSPPAQQTRRQRRRMVARQLVDRGIRQRPLLPAT